MVAARAAARSPTEALTSLREAGEGAREVGVLAHAARRMSAEVAKARFTGANPTLWERCLLAVHPAKGEFHEQTRPSAFSHYPRNPCRLRRRKPRSAGPRP